MIKEVAAGAPGDAASIEASPRGKRAAGAKSLGLHTNDQTPEGYRLTQQIVLSEFGLQALQIGSLDELLQKATESCARGMSVRLAKVLRYDHEQHRLLMCAGVGWKDGTVGSATVGADLESPAGYALQTGKPVISNHLENEDRFRTPGVMIEHDVKRAINVLITAQRRPWGVLEVDSPDEGQFEVEDIAFMQGFANLVGVAIERHDAELKLQEAIAHQRLLVQEASHRVKNSLSMVSSLLHLQARSGVSEETASALGEAEARIATIAEAHDQLWRSTTAGQINVRDFLSDLCQRMQRQSQRIQIKCSIASCMLSAERAITLGLLVTELVTNAMKYAYPRGTETVFVNFDAFASEISLTVSDKGCGLPTGFDVKEAGRQSLGMRMVDSLSRQLRGKIAIRTGRDAGTEFRVVAPMH